MMNEERFTGKADIYKKFRPTYPKEFIDYLYSQVGFTQNSAIADIGSGTGIFSRLFLERGSRVYCVEPHDDMRRTAEQDLAGFKGFVSVNAPAENTGLQTQSVEFVTAAQALHWFDRQAFKLECQRILKDSGKVVIVYNSKVENSDVIRKNDEIIDKYCSDTKGHRQRGESPENYSDFFVRQNNQVCEYKTFKNDYQFTRENFIGRILSSSYVPKKETDPENYHGLMKAMNKLFDEYNINGILHFPQITKSYVGGV
jgi:ubiquinone/menaquinone biosynthesis C-methylase UbiE